MRASVIIPLVLAAGLVAGCRKPVAPPPPATSAPNGPTKAQAKLPVVKLWLGSHEILAEVARTPIQVQTGMMFRQEMAENEGMLFVFDQPHRVSFYMRNTVLPLSCAYLDSEGAILEIHDMKPLDETPIEAASDRIQFVLETRQGWFQRHGIGPGVVVRTERGPLYFRP